MDTLKAMAAMVMILGAVLVGFIVAPLLVFAVKASLIKPQVNKDTGIGSIAGQSVMLAGTFVLALIPLSICWHWGIAAFHKDLVPVFSRHYANGCSDCGLSAYWNMLGSEAWPYFLATAVAMFAKGCGELGRKATGSTVAAITPAVVAGFVFVLFLYGDDIILTAKQLGLPSALLAIFARWAEEIISIKEPIVAMMNGQSFWAWLHDEVAQLHVSLFKLSALYPKVFWVFAAYNFFSWSHADTH
ncbi:MAG: hypothetical protein WC670_04335 [Pseudolabrys sp.]|jgi:hypothetical protein